ncbi:MAG: hypothetical protein D6701_02060 [Gemmatimonadetes bacterium]|nr:MAG: hypothetical protein D6701_02060 [Gemmatimonadota bacterium]
MAGFQQNARDTRSTLRVLITLALVAGLLMWPPVRALPLWQKTLLAVGAALALSLLGELTPSRRAHRQRLRRLRLLASVLGGAQPPPGYDLDAECAWACEDRIEGADDLIAASHELRSAAAADGPLRRPALLVLMAHSPIYDSEVLELVRAGLDLLRGSPLTDAQRRRLELWEAALGPEQGPRAP